MKKVIVFLLGVSVLFLSGRYFYRFLESDKCLDRGGRWSYELDSCDYGLKELYEGYWISDFHSFFDTSRIEDDFEPNRITRYTIETDSSSYIHTYKGDTLFEVSLSHEIDLIEFRFMDNTKGVLNALFWDSTKEVSINEPSLVFHSSRFEFLDYDLIKITDDLGFTDTLDIRSLRPEVIKMDIDTLHKLMQR